MDPQQSALAAVSRLDRIPSRCMPESSPSRDRERSRYCALLRQAIRVVADGGDCMATACLPHLAGRRRSLARSTCRLAMVPGMTGRALVRLFLHVAASGALLLTSRAQAKPAPPDAEAAVAVAAAKELCTYAALCTKNGFPSRARELWFEVLGEYDTDAAEARQALGFYRHGTIWQRQPDFVYPERDEPDAAVARMLTQRWSVVAPKLAELHAARAAVLTAAGDVTKALHHQARAERFRSGDGNVGDTAAVATNGDALAQALLQRSRQFDQRLTELLTAPMPAAAPAEAELPLAAPAGRKLTCVRSANFTIFGDQPVEVLLQAAGWGERALAFCTDATAGVAGFPVDRPQSRVFVFFRQRAYWAMYVRKHWEGSGAEFVVENANATELGDVETAFAEQAEMVHDIVVRRVAEDWFGCRSPALIEGVGHAVVGMFFRRNLMFTVGEPDPRLTVAGVRTATFEAPDLETWRRINLELAWQRADAPAANLPRLELAKFTSPARIKAWSFCDFLLRVDPVLLHQLDAAGVGAGSDAEVVGAFAAAAGRPLAELEARWRQLWTQDGPLKAAVLGRHSPLTAASQGAAAWLAQWNRLRQRVGTASVGWSAPQSLACKQHVDYLLANKDQRGPAAEHSQLAGRPLATAFGRAFAQQALVVVGKLDEKQLLAEWLLLPGYRDALLNPNLATIGIYADAGIAVFDVERGFSSNTGGQGRSWPLADDGERAKQPLPASAPRERFGAAVTAALTPLWPDAKPPARIGYPLTLHRYRGDGAVTCKVTAGGVDVAGALLAPRDGPRTLAAPGLWVFYPAAPLPIGKDLRVEWRWPEGGIGVTFTAS
jgi:hypothetical protein